MPKKATDWTGHTFGCLTVLGKGSKKDAHGRVRWEVKCVCGKIYDADIRDLKKSVSRGLPCSCGCVGRQKIAEKKSTHKMSRHPAFSVWRSMLARCTNPKHRAWKNYGGRGIAVCEAWLHSFESFWADMGPTYQPGLDLDRKDNEKGYSPENCRWVTRTRNNRNRRTNRFVTVPTGERVTVSEAAERYRIKYTTLLYRLGHGWTLETALTEPARSTTSSTRAHSTVM